jgi:hypothetical protein
VSRGFEPLPPSLSLPGGLVGVFGAIIEVAVLPVLDTRQELARGGTVASQLIRDDHAWDVPQAPQQLSGEALRRLLVSPVLHKNVEGIPSWSTARQR